MDERSDAALLLASRDDPAAFVELYRRHAETLADDQREALKLRVIDGLPYPDVAARLQCAETAARQRVSRGLRRLALVLQERGLMLTAEVE